jgi:uncharacterized protein (DUF302 family)
LDPAAVTLKTAASPHSVAGTVDRMIAALEARGIVVFARIDHAEGAREAGLELPDEQLLVFGDPRVGTLLMQEDPSVGYELPLRVLVWDADRQTTVGWRQPTELVKHYELSSHRKGLERMDALLEQLVAESTAAP